MSTKESTVAEWQSHFQVNQSLTLPDYQVDWTTIRNNSEGVGVEVAIGTVRRYLARFRESLPPAFKSEQVELSHRIGSDSVASLLILQSTLGSLTIEAERHLGQCKYMADAVETTLSLLQENVVWSELEAKAAKLESELDLAKAQVESLRVEADAQKELRLRAVNKTVYGS